MLKHEDARNVAAECRLPQCDGRGPHCRAHSVSGGVGRGLGTMFVFPSTSGIDHESTRNICTYRNWEQGSSTTNGLLPRVATCDQVCPSAWCLQAYTCFGTNGHLPPFSGGYSRELCSASTSAGNTCGRCVHSLRCLQLRAALQAHQRLCTLLSTALLFTLYSKPI